MLQGRQNSSKCTFCKNYQQQTHLLLKSIYLRLKRQLSSLQKYSILEWNGGDSHAFRQLIHIIFPHLFEKVSNCQHRSYFSYFIRKLKINSQTMNFLCDRLSQAVAEKNYHLEIISIQIKNASNSIVEDKIIPQVKYAEEASRRQEIVSERVEKDEQQRQRGEVQNNINQQEVPLMPLIPILGQQANISSNSEVQYSFFYSLPIFYHPGPIL